MLITGTLFSAWAQEKGTFTDDRDGHIYQWIKIGDQIWMAENLAYLPAMHRISDALFDCACYYVYDYDGNDIDEAKVKFAYRKYGVLYNWTAAIAACPEGWHLPDDKEWIALEQHLGMNDNESGNRGWRVSGETGQKIKSVAGWYVNNGTDDAGFSALPGGCRGYGGYESEGYCAYFWTASPAGGDNGWRRGFCCDDIGSCREEDRRYFAISVRCVKD